MRTVNTLCKSNLEVYALCNAADTDGDGYIEKHEFTRVVGELLRGDEFTATQLFTLALRFASDASRGGSTRSPGRLSQRRLSSGDGKLSMDDFSDCLSVVHLKQLTGDST